MWLSIIDNSRLLLFVAQMNTARCIGERQQKEYYKNTTADGQSYEGMKVEGGRLQRSLEDAPEALQFSV